MYTFNSQVKERGSFLASFEKEALKNEPMFFNSGLDFAYKYGGIITKEFIDHLPDDWKNCNPVLDSRVHMLMPRWYPCIPGYHHDDIPRDAVTGQPDYETPTYYSEHLMGLVNGDICPTIFALGKHSLPKITTGIIYQQWHEEILQQIAAGILAITEAPSGRYLEFDWQSSHTGQRAKASGWRWFVRLSRNTDRQHTITNESRRQVQVYLDPMTEGW